MSGTALHNLRSPRPWRSRPRHDDVSQTRARTGQSGADRRAHRRAGHQFAGRYRVPPTCEAAFPSGTAVTLTPAQDVAWTTGCNGAGVTCTVIVDRWTEVRATAAGPPPQLLALGLNVRGDAPDPPISTRLREPRSRGVGVARAYRASWPVDLRDALRRAVRAPAQACQACAVRPRSRVRRGSPGTLPPWPRSRPLGRPPGASPGKRRPPLAWPSRRRCG